MDSSADQFAHFILPGSPATGASLVASFVAQHVQLSGRAVTVIDASPDNSTLADFDALAVQKWNLWGSDGKDPKPYEDMFDFICKSGNDFVIDVGAQNFAAMAWCLHRHDVLERLTSNRRQMVVHAMIRGGPGLHASRQHFSQIAGRLDASVPIIVWLNNYWGTTETDGNSFEESDEYLRHKSKIRGLVRLHRAANNLFSVNLADMFERRLTFPEIRMAYGFTLNEKQRLVIISREIFQQLAVVML